MSSEELQKKSGLRKRILGALILFALAIIFLPVFFEYVPNNVYLPKLVSPPQEPKVELLKPSDFANTTNIPLTVTATAAWSVKLTHVAGEPTKLVKELMQAGYPAYLQNGKDIFVGPETNKKTIEEWVQAFHQKNFETAVVAYEPGK